MTHSSQRHFNEQMCNKEVGKMEERGSGHRAERHNMSSNQWGSMLLLSRTSSVWLPGARGGSVPGFSVQVQNHSGSEQ